MKNDRVIFELSDKYAKGDVDAGIALLKCYAYAAFVCDYKHGITYDLLSYRDLGLKKGETLFKDLKKSFKELDSASKKSYEAQIKGIDKDIKKALKTVAASLKTVHQNKRVPLDKAEVAKQEALEKEISATFGLDFSSLSSRQLETSESFL